MFALTHSQFRLIMDLPAGQRRASLMYHAPHLAHRGDTVESESESESESEDPDTQEDAANNGAAGASNESRM